MSIVRATLNLNEPSFSRHSDRRCVGRIHNAIRGIAVRYRLIKPAVHRFHGFGGIALAVHPWTEHPAGLWAARTGRLEIPPKVGDSHLSHVKAALPSTQGSVAIAYELPAGFFA